MRAFHRAHRERYGYSDTEIEVEVVNLRVYCRGMGEVPVLEVEEPSTRRVPLLTRRRVFLGGKLVSDCRVFDRKEIGPGWKGKGPCVVEDYDSTLVIPPGCSYEVDETGSYRILMPS